MLTTDTAGRKATTGSLVVAATVSLVVGLVLSGTGAAVAGSPAGYGALLGTAVAVVVFAFGSFAVDAVARVMPAASLLFAMLTYTFQVVVMALVFVGVTRSGLLEDTLDRRWLGAAVIAVVVSWCAVQLRAATTARIPLYEAGAR
ncbi:MAG TPA: hypothetical protein VD859_07110 [Nocardioides sp.]|nr:hypothetical protein [Nocardioides sp.]